MKKPRKPPWGEGPFTNFFHQTAPNRPNRRGPHSKPPRAAFQTAEGRHSKPWAPRHAKPNHRRLHSKPWGPTASGTTSQFFGPSGGARAIPNHRRRAMPNQTIGGAIPNLGPKLHYLTVLRALGGPNCNTLQCLGPGGPKQ